MVKSLRIGHRRFMLSAGVNTVGRDPASTVCVNDASVSRHHARITVDGDAALIEDCGSRNGTWVGGQQTKGRVRLNDGDDIVIAGIRVMFRRLDTGSGNEPTT